jgi:hypothetical protein
VKPNRDLRLATCARLWGCAVAGIADRLNGQAGVSLEFELRIITKTSGPTFSAFTALFVGGQRLDRIQ